MNFKAPQLLSFAPPILEIPAHQTWHRVQRAKAGRGSVRLKGYVLAPTGGLTGRFDLADEPMAYLADSPETALYESVFRREVRSCHWDRLLERSMMTIETRASLRLADLRGLEERYPVLQSMRYETSQKFAQDCRQQGLHGILYASAQHPHHSCVCLFKAGIEKTRKLITFALVEPGTGNLLRSAANAARGSQVPIVRE
ncbi:RES family NAD+ phosphorylase [Rhodoferax sp.]|uniref:RES family NAD+ phosphorylase n=1 Tax=Rhodoferax sp. TaxID=50421 RepID=UPI00271A4E91|nr:RES family NAD+ phosphorylase [Rhodoferax sp.]MDO9198916.1 RES family NAD+ phosphorylase [Rhodoferax sp.]